MTKKELSQLYYLIREIEEQQRRIKELEDLSRSCTSQITGMPKIAGWADKIGKYAVEIADLKSQLNLNLKKCFNELDLLNRYIGRVTDSQMRVILRLRYINGLSWEQVAANISSSITGESVRKAHDRFLSQKES